MKLRALCASLVTATLVATGVGLASPATAGGPRVAISPIPSVTVAYGAKATIRPRVTASGNVAVSSSRLTVVQGRTVLAKNLPAVTLRPGVYTVTTTAVYRTYADVTTTRPVTTSTVEVAAGQPTGVSCVASDLRTDQWYRWFTASCTGAAFTGTRSLGLHDWINEAGVRTLSADGGDRLTLTGADVAEGATFAATLTPGGDLVRTTVTARTVTARQFSSAKSAALTQKLVITSAKAPKAKAGASAGGGRTLLPLPGGTCPSSAPIKGNANSGIYHLPTQRYYAATKAEKCFSTERAAIAAGFRRAKV